MKNIVFLIIIILAGSNLLQPPIIIAQSGKTPPTSIGYYNLNHDGNQSNVKLSLTPPPAQQFSDEKKQLLQQLEIARTSNDAANVEQIQQQLNNLNGVIPVQQPPDPRTHFEFSRFQNPPFQPDYVVSQIHNFITSSSATGTVPVGAPNAGRVWVASTKFAGFADTLKFFYSDNGGSSWNYFGAIWMNFNYGFRPDELDIELVYDGTNIWMFGVAGLHDYTDSRDKCMLFRFNTAGGPGYAILLNFPGSVAGNNYYNPRLCSDNSNYTTFTYVSIICSLDSLGGGNHAVKQKYLLLTSVFGAAPTFSYTQPSGAAGFYWYNSGTPTRIYLYGDIAYYRQGGNNRIMTVFSDAAYGFTNMYLAWSNDYGSTIAGNLTLAEGVYSTGARIAFNGGPAYTSGMISYVRQSSGTDWDPFAQNTTTGGTTTGGWTGAFINGSVNRARTLDVIAIRGANNMFKSAYAQDNPTVPNVFYQGFNGVSWGSYPFVVSNLTPDTTFAKPRAGYLNGGGDDCLTIWSLALGVNAYDSRLCSSTLGIRNNQIPVSYSLSQNYPNPFNPVTIISFELPKESNVTLKVYNIIGEVVSVLVNEHKQAGSYEVNFDASNFASGVYFYKLEAGEFTNTKKMMVIK